MNSEWGLLGPIGVLTPSKYNSEVDSTFFRNESMVLPYVNNNETKLGSLTYYSLYVDFP